VNSYEALKLAVNKVGAKRAANELGLSLSTLYKWIEPSHAGASGTANPLDRVAQVCRLANDTAPVAWLCQQAGGFFVKNAEARQLDGGKVLQETHRVLRQFSSVLDAVSRGFDDGKLPAEEARDIRAEWEALKSMGESFVGACEGQVTPSRQRGSNP
jgi:hypothetical protein